ncbi:hypothetical protein B0T16DRAFT_395435 [Cercophora newfieldiana]|uniref:Uncharacterized protein n=1 Tax=Cercophora newfieldiana TaxID=92897 RepID=A0AA39XT52_9PEZI|nr:hypothetical protein B0T16DRAFT_395435 [Cercophora newfieldiana]
MHLRTLLTTTLAALALHLPLVTGTPIPPPPAALSARHPDPNACLNARLDSPSICATPEYNEAIRKGELKRIWEAGSDANTVSDTESDTESDFEDDDDDDELEFFTGHGAAVIGVSPLGN